MNNFSKGGGKSMQKNFRLLFQRFHYAALLIIMFSALAFIAGCGGSSSSGGDLTKVYTTYGFVNGYATDSTLIWKGIPYAKPPVGDLRWKAPVDPDPWTDIRDATSSCSECIQQVSDKFWRPASSSAFTGSEDCLYLDIYRPQTNTPNLPVYVWIHGGANVIGSAKLYDGSALAKRGNMIVVVIQYRLSVLGWMTHPALRTSSTAQDNSGNYATLDTMKALSWIQNNIASFGGDPTKVTIGGQSAGGQNVMNLIISPMVNNFQQAFAESPALSTVMPLRTQAAGDTTTNGLIDWLLIDDGLAADATAAAAYRAGMSNAQIETYLRGKTAAKILQAAIDGPGNGMVPAATAFMDGTVMPTTSWLDTINAGNFKKVPLIIGTTQYEFKDLMTLYGTSLKLLSVPSGLYSWNDLYDVLDGTNTLGAVLPTATDVTEYEKTGLLKSREWQSECNSIARAIKTNSAANTVYSYYFTWSGGGDPALADFKFIFGGSHAQDVPFFFGAQSDLFGGYSFTTANQAGRVALQGAMMDYLISFVKAGDPNPTDSALLNWTQWSNTDGDNKFIIFDADLNNYLLSMDSAEATTAIVSAEKAAVLAANPGFALLFMILGI
jgi:Carboxylesterase type B